MTRISVVAAVSTPLHIRSLTAYLRTFESDVPVHVLLIDLDPNEPRNAFYIQRLARENVSRSLRIERAGVVDVWRFVVLQAYRRRDPRTSLILAAGNLRRWQSLVLARFAEHIDVLEEGIGTTRAGAYFDPATAESSRLKRIGQAVGLLPAYPEVCRRIRAHHTSYDTSVFAPINKVDFVESDLVGSTQLHGLPHEVVIVVASVFRRIGHSRYEAIVRSQLAARVNAESIYFSYHPKDDTSAVRAFCREQGIRMLESELILEDVIVTLLMRGHRVLAVGDRNSSVALVNAIAKSPWQWADQTDGSF